MIEGGEASSWNYVQKLKKHLKHFFTKVQLSTIDIFSEIFHFKVGRSPQQCCHLRSNFLGIGIYYLTCKSISVVTLIMLKPCIQKLSNQCKRLQ